MHTYLIRKCHLVGVVQMVQSPVQIEIFSWEIFAYHLNKQSTNRFSHENIKQPISRTWNTRIEQNLHLPLEFNTAWLPCLSITGLETGHYLCSGEGVGKIVGHVKFSMWPPQLGYVNSK